MNKTKRLGFWILTALVVGNMVGSGIFMLPRTLSEVASPAGVLLAWGLTGAGVLAIALVFGNLIVRKPSLTGGPQIYAKELFKSGTHASIFAGFISSWGYWIGNFAGNVAIVTTFAGYLATFFPILTSQKELLSVGNSTINIGNASTFLVCSLLLWGIHFIILQGISGAGIINLVATATKLIGFLLFIIIGLFAFESSNFTPVVAPRYNEAGQSIGLLSQVNRAAVSTLWAFIGVESAMVFASRAKRETDVKRATILGLLLALAIYIGISMLVMGMLSQEALVHSDKPLIDAIETVLGPLGAKLLAGLGLVSLIGSTIGWVLLSAEVPYQAAKQGLFLPSFLKTNEKGIPTFSLVLSNGLAQLLIFSTVFNTISAAFDFVIYIATLAYLIPYFISSVFQLKLAVTGETYHLDSKSRMIDGIIAIVSTIYSVWVIIAGTADIVTFTLGMGLLLTGIVFYQKVAKYAKQGFEQ